MQAALLRDARIAEAKVLRAFPTFVWKAQLKPEIYRCLNAEILRKLDAVIPRDLAAATGWQSGYWLHTTDAFRPLISCFGRAVEQVLEFLRVPPRKFEVTGCWANVNCPGVAHSMHTHPNNFLSGVYYVQVQEGADTINFHDPRTNRDHAAGRQRTDRLQYGSGGGQRPKRDAAPLPGVVAAFGGCQSQ